MGAPHGSCPCENCYGGRRTKQIEDELLEKIKNKKRFLKGKQQQTPPKRKKRRNEEIPNAQPPQPLPIVEPKRHMTLEEVQITNAYMSKSIQEYRRKTKQMDLLNYDPQYSLRPQIHFLDVSTLTHNHPHTREYYDKVESVEKMEKRPEKRRKLCENLNNAPMVDSWNHVLYSNMRDMARAEQRAANVPPQLNYRAGAPLGSPYAAAVPAVAAVPPNVDTEHRYATGSYGSW